MPRDIGKEPKASVAVRSTMPGAAALLLLFPNIYAEYTRLRRDGKLLRSSHILPDLRELPLKFQALPAL